MKLSAYGLSYPSPKLVPSTTWPSAKSVRRGAGRIGDDARRCRATVRRGLVRPDCGNDAPGSRPRQGQVADCRGEALRFRDQGRVRRSIGASGSCCHAGAVTALPHLRSGRMQRLDELPPRTSSGRQQRVVALVFISTRSKASGRQGLCRAAKPTNQNNHEHLPSRNDQRTPSALWRPAEDRRHQARPTLGPCF